MRMNKTTEKQKGSFRGIIYPLIAFTVHAFLAQFITQGWITAGGALAITSFIGYLDHEVLPNVNI